MAAAGALPFIAVLLFYSGGLGAVSWTYDYNPFAARQDVEIRPKVGSAKE